MREPARAVGATIVPPVYVDPSAELVDCVVGPNASIGPGVRVEKSTVEDSIVDEGARIEQTTLRGSLVGRRAIVRGFRGSANVADDSALEAE